MSFGAGVATKAFLWLVVFIYLRDQIVSGGGLMQCFKEECGVGNNRTKARKNGEVLCSRETRGVPGLACEYKCLGEKVDEDQLECWKWFCGSFPEGFCVELGRPGIKADQCEKYLNEGKAGVAANAVLWLLILSLLQDQLFSYAADPKCLEDCGGDKAKYKAEKNGEVLCSSEDLILAKNACEMECYHAKPDEDQLQCWKGLCSGGGIQYALKFCEKPGGPSIKPEQCEEYLNAGKVKYHARACPDYIKYLEEQYRMQSTNN